MAIVMDGKALAEKMQANLAKKVSQLQAEKGIQPGLLVILVGDNPASQVYVRNKERSAIKAGFYSETLRLPEETTQENLLSLIDQYNHDARIHGILVQLPLPDHIDEERVLLAISPEKDVDGFHPMNTGHLWNGKAQMIPCTPAGILELLREYEVTIEGKEAVIIGRSNIVGKPMAQLLLDQNATVTLTHSRTKDLASVCRRADILIVAIGQGHFVTQDFIKPGAVVVDVGMNRDQEGKLIGDVAYDQVKDLTGYITPVPGGVGPMTITMLLEQTYEAACQKD